MPTTIQIGSTGPEVAKWQQIIGVKPDGEFGPRTDAATREWQRKHGLTPDGVVGELTWAGASKGPSPSDAKRTPPSDASKGPPPSYLFIGARNFTPDRFGSAITLVVVHTMEAPEKPSTARKVAEWFRGSTAPQSSAHYCVDADEIIQCVYDEHAAWAAPGANRNGVHIEHAGYAKQNAADWSDEYSEAMLRKSAALAADLCARYAIPIRRLTTAEVLAKARGLCGHVEVTKAFKKGDHTDPGPNFPWDRYLELIRAATAQRANETPPEPSNLVS
jgi:N-acetyl-anhydromuramyl-L-alanine amidase AmpD